VSKDKRDLYAYMFQSDLTLEAMLARLEEEGSLGWQVRDNDNWGEYLSARALPPPFHSSVKVISEPGHFVVNVSISLWERDVPAVRDPEAQFATFRELLFTRLLPAIGARSLTPTEDYE
jgi:hypothetical protein